MNTTKINQNIIWRVRTLSHGNLNGGFIEQTRSQNKELIRKECMDDNGGNGKVCPRNIKDSRILVGSSGGDDTYFLLRNNLEKSPLFNSNKNEKSLG